MLKILLILSALILGTKSQLDQLPSINKYPYKLLSSYLDLSLPQCVFFNFFSYTAFYFNRTELPLKKELPQSSSNEETTYKLFCSFNKNDKLTYLIVQSNDEAIVTRIKLNLTITEVQKDFYIYDKNDQYSFIQLQLNSKFLNISSKKESMNTNADDWIIKNGLYNFNQKEPPTFTFEHLMLRNCFIRNASFFGYSCLFSGLFITILGSLYHQITTFLLSIFFFVGLMTEIAEPLLPSNMFTESLAFIFIIIGILVGGFMGWLIIQNNTIEKVFYGLMNGLVLFKIISFCYLLIFEQGFQGEMIVIDLLWAIFGGLFGVLWYYIPYILLFEILSTSVVGSFYLVRGFNFLLGGYLEDALVFKIRKICRDLNDKNIIWKEFKKHWANKYVLMYFVIWIIFSLLFFFIQCYLRYRQEQEKPPNEQKSFLMLNLKKNNLGKIYEEDSHNKKGNDNTNNSNKNKRTDNSSQDDEESNMSVNRYSNNNNNQSESS